MNTTNTVFAPSDITIPADGSTTARDILSAYLRKQYRTLLAIPFARLTGTSEGDAFVERMRALAKEDPGLLFTILRKPTIGGLIRLIATRDGSMAEIAHWAAEIMGLIGFELAAAGRGSGTVPAAGAYPMLTSLHGRVALAIPSTARTVTFDGSIVSWDGLGSGAVDLDEAPVGLEHPYHTIRDAIVLATYDNNPRAGVEAHPDKAGNHVDLGAKSADEWVASLREAFDMVEAHTPQLVPEINLLIHQMVPVGFEPEKHLSASLMELIGNIYLSLHPDPVVMAEAIVHEFSHNKINMLWSLNPLLENAFQPLYSSPVRPDPRPLFGVLLAVHAFLPVETMYLAMRDADHPVTRHPRFASRLAQVRKANAEAAATVLGNGIPTPAGQPVLEEIRRLDAELAARH
jgi:HEXXH motif-containing protein